MFNHRRASPKPCLVARSGSVTQRRGSSRTSSRSNRSKHRYSDTSEFLAHVQLDDAPRAPIQQSFGEEFRQHDGVVTILMFNCRRASPKHRYNMTEVEYGGGCTAHG